MQMSKVFEQCEICSTDRVLQNWNLEGCEALREGTRA